jgi:hypothetical protein
MILLMLGAVALILTALLIGDALDPGRGSCKRG